MRKTDEERARASIRAGEAAIRATFARRFRGRLSKNRVSPFLNGIRA